MKRPRERHPTVITFWGIKRRGHGTPPLMSMRFQKPALRQPSVRNWDWYVGRTASASLSRCSLFTLTPTSLTQPPAVLANVASAVDARIRTLLDAERARWALVDPDLALPIDALAKLVLAGGKRLRPAFCFLGFTGAGGDPSDPLLVDVGAGLELLHTFALVHDDIMDDSTTRRGMRAMHVQFIDQHRNENWGGEARRFGEGVAILVGDLAFVYADILLRSVNNDATTK
jgi:hypothetical protein